MSQTRPDPRVQRPYRVAPHLRTRFNRRQSRLAQLKDRRNPRIERSRMRARARNLIRGDLITHRRMFGVSHKHVQPGEVPAERAE